ncbi:MAG: iron-containing alcohol dehydrogenase, partial [Anaerolineae bacterium]|nr:iron-containing alcohol dehydrogenase [Anaerolineae bacterium]
SAERAAPLLARLDAAGVAYETFAVAHEPTVDLALAGTGRARELGAELVIAFGGGSVIDAGKAIAALLTNPGDPFDYLEVIGRGQPLPNAAAPVIAIPTTAGTGSEVTRNAVLASPEHHVKVSLRSPRMLPAVALVDPELTYGLPPAITAYTGLDALTQVIEPFVTSAANPLTDAICREGITRAGRALRRAVARGDDSEARADMAFAALCGGLALANARLGAVHGFAGPFGGMFDAPHGAVCAALLPHVMAANVAALRARAPQHPSLRRYEEIARLLTGNARASADEGVAWVHDLVADLSVPGLAAYGLNEAAFDTLIPAARRSSSMKGNPVALSDDELRAILARAM